jgi:energy-coupling factor transport system substrate-specific component
LRLAAASLAGLALFFWPFAGLGLPPATPAVAVTVGTVFGLALVEFGTRRLDTRLLALLAALAAADAALRMALVSGIGGFSPIFLLVLCAGYVFGPSFGFLCGATALLVSALATGGLGPWIPYQVFAVGWVGAGAGLAGLRFRGTWPLAVVGLAGGFAFGALLDVWDWTFFQGSGGLGWSPGLPAGETLLRFGRFYLLTSLAYDSFRGVGNLLLVVLLAAPVLAALRRLRSRFSLTIVPVTQMPALERQESLKC